MDERITIIRDDIDMTYSVYVFDVIKVGDGFTNEIDAEKAAIEYLKQRGLIEAEKNERRVQAQPFEGTWG